METYMVKRAFIIIIIIYVFSVFILCLFSLLYIYLFEKRNKYVALDFFADFLRYKPSQRFGGWGKGEAPCFTGFSLLPPLKTSITHRQS
jgi:hypothetical protein